MLVVGMCRHELHFAILHACRWENERLSINTYQTVPMNNFTKFSSSFKGSLLSKSTVADVKETVDETSARVVANKPPPVAEDLNPTLTGKAWKRRGGLKGKLAKATWELRPISLVGNKLYYYFSDEERQKLKDSSQQSWFDQAKAVSATAKNKLGINDTNTTDLSKPRGYLNIKEEKALIHAGYGYSGAPSPFCICFQVGLETKWMLAFDSFSEQIEWLAALSTVVATNSVDEYNLQLLEKLSVASANTQTEGGGGALFVHQSLVREPPIPFDQDGPSGRQSVHRLWTLNSFKVEYKADIDRHDETTARNSIQQQSIAESNNSLMQLVVQSQNKIKSMEAEQKRKEVEWKKQLSDTRNELLNDKATTVLDEKTLLDQSIINSNQERSALQETIVTLQKEAEEIEEKHRAAILALKTEHAQELTRQNESMSPMTQLTAAGLLNGESQPEELGKTLSELQIREKEERALNERIQSLENQLVDQQTKYEGELSATRVAAQELQNELAELRERNQALIISLESQTDMHTQKQEGVACTEAAAAKKSDVERLAVETELTATLRLLEKLAAEKNMMEQTIQSLQTLLKTSQLQQKQESDAQIQSLKNELARVQASYEDSIESIRVEHSHQLKKQEAEIKESCSSATAQEESIVQERIEIEKLELQKIFSKLEKEKAELYEKINVGEKREAALLQIVDTVTKRVGGLGGSLQTAPHTEELGVDDDEDFADAEQG
jgi:hypothetical protein